MTRKKDPGKFTVRFNIADPQQRAVADLLNQQGRCKAQFITNAVLFYTYAVSDGRLPFLSNGVAVHGVMDAWAAQRDALSSMEEQDPMEVPSNVPAKEIFMENADMESIRRTMETFQTQ